MLYIKVDDKNNHIGHPITLENLILLFENHNFELGPPKGYKKFIRLRPPNIRGDQTFEDVVGKNEIGWPGKIPNSCGLKYEYDEKNDVFHDVWYFRNLTEEEKIAKRKRMHELWLNSGGSKQWIFNENTYWFDPPIPFPEDDNKPYIWSDDHKNWILSPYSTSKFQY